MINYKTKILTDDEVNGLKFRLLKQSDGNNEIYQYWCRADELATNEGLAKILSVCMKLRNDPEAFIKLEDTVRL